MDNLKGHADSAAEEQRAEIIRTAKLSPCEKAVLRHYLSGMSVTAIAALLQRSKKTISSQKVSMMRKLGVSSNQELVLVASNFPELSMTT
ncbi:LuxR C-terminal-related transcriptional regulator [Stenotrophomonas sp. G106K1]|uniref:response regulator transcription factor n=1 Tax=Stenotrophomonas sp. G106K1 TaxID=3134792 RepID=UPI0030F40511